MNIVNRCWLPCFRLPNGDSRMIPSNWNNTRQIDRVQKVSYGMSPPTHSPVWQCFSYPNISWHPSFTYTVPPVGPHIVSPDRRQNSSYAHLSATPVTYPLVASNLWLLLWEWEASFCGFVSRFCIWRWNGIHLLSCFSHIPSIGSSHTGYSEIFQLGLPMEVFHTVTLRWGSSDCGTGLV